MSKQALESEVMDVHGEPAITFDEVINDPKSGFEEMDISLETKSGKVFIASALKGAKVILQGIVKGYISKDSAADLPGATLDYVAAKGLSPDVDTEFSKAALFSGSIYFEKLPVTVLETKGEDKDQLTLPLFEDKVKPEVKAEEKESKAEPKEKGDTTSTGKTIKDNKISDVELPPIPSKVELETIKAGQLKAKQGFSRQARRIWWEKLREMYPKYFDKGGNWLGMGEDVKAEPTEENDKVTTKAVELVKKARPLTNVKQDPPGTMIEIGAGNRITNMTDETILTCLFIGRFFEGRGYSVISTPGEGDEAAFILCNKERTAKFMIAGMRRNRGFKELVEGCNIYPVTEFKEKWFKKENQLVYFVTNAVTALQALGTQEKDIADIVEQLK